MQEARLARTRLAYYKCMVMTTVYIYLEIYGLAVGSLAYSVCKPLLRYSIHLLRKSESLAKDKLANDKKTSV